MSIQEQYRQKRRSAYDAVDEVHDGDVIVVPTGVGEPPALLQALSDRRRDFHDVCIAQILPLAPYGYFDPETTGHVRHLAYFLGGASRPGAQQAGSTRLRATSRNCRN